MSELSLNEINERIKREICTETLNALSDESLMPFYKECKSVQNKLQEFSVILDSVLHDKSHEKDLIIEKYTLQLIPSGTKGVIRGNMFNKIVKNFIEKIGLDSSTYEICFEKICEQHPTTEIPDWYILEKSTNKIIIGMNQLDLWSGGHQTNRGSKYIHNNIHNTETSKLLCVVSNEIQLTSKRSKTYTLFDSGFKNNTLCYLKNLENIILSFFAQ